MTGLRVIDGIRCLRLGVPRPAFPDRWWALPSRVAPEPAPSGRPAVIFLGTGNGALLQLAARIEPGPERLDALRSRLEEALLGEGRTRATAVLLAPAPLSIGIAELRIAGAAGDVRCVDRRTPGSVTPHITLFRGDLDRHEAGLMRRALGGQPGIASIRFSDLAWGPSARSMAAEAQPSDRGDPATDGDLLPPLPAALEGDLALWARTYPFPT